MLHTVLAYVNKAFKTVSSADQSPCLHGAYILVGVD